MDQIGIVVWGTKRGKTEFFHSPHIDISSPEIADTIKDIRNIIRFPKPGVEFYAIEYTSKYKVFTIYRSVYDWTNSPGYLAITLYIPGELANGRAFRLIQDLKNKYVELYLDRSYRIKNERENASVFFEMIAGTKVEPRKYTWSPSTQNDEYGLIYYKSEQEIIDFFDDPCRSKFYGFQEVIFLNSANKKPYSSLNLIEEKAKRIRYDIDFNLSTPDGNIIYTHNYQIDGTLNGNPIYSSGDLKGISETDLISLKIKMTNYDDFYIRETLAKSIGTISGNTITLKHKFVPSKYKVQVKAIDAKTGKGIEGVKLELNDNFCPSTNNKGESQLMDVIFEEDQYLTYRKEGYEPFQKSHKLNPKDSTVTIKFNKVKPKVEVIKYTIEVKDTEGKPIKQANLSIGGTGLGETNHKGEFETQELDKQRRKILLVSKRGYEDEEFILGNNLRPKIELTKNDGVISSTSSGSNHSKPTSYAASGINANAVNEVEVDPRKSWDEDRQEEEHDVPFFSKNY